MTEKPQQTPKHDEGAGRRPASADSSQVLSAARAQFAELTGLSPETVSSLAREGDGWTLRIEVLELARVPDTASLLATYEVHADEGGGLTGYRRVRRYERGRPDPS